MAAVEVMAQPGKLADAAMDVDAPAAVAEPTEEDLYTRLKTLQRQLEFLDIQEEYIKEEQKNLKRELLRAQEEVKRIQSVPLVIGQFGIVGSTTGSNYYVRILSTLNRELLKPSASVALHRHSNALVDILPPEADSSISLLADNERPDVSYQVRTDDAWHVVCTVWSQICAVHGGGLHVFGKRLAGVAGVVTRDNSESHVWQIHLTLLSGCVGCPRRTLAGTTCRSRRSARPWSSRWCRRTCTSR